MKINFIFSTVFIASLLLFSCSSDDDDDDLPDPGIDPIPTGMTYTKDIKGIMDQSCNVSGCHNTTKMAAGFALSNYDEVKDAFMNDALIQIENGAMPKNESKLPQATINKIKGWIAEDYKE